MKPDEVIGNHLKQVQALFFLLVFLDRSYDMKALRDDFYFQLLAGHQWVAVKMQYTIMRAVDVDFLRSHGLDTAVLVDCLVEQLERKARDIQYIEWFHDCDIHQSVCQRCLGSDVRIVAILRGIPASYQEGFLFHGAFLVFYFVSFRFVCQAFV